VHAAVLAKTMVGFQLYNLAICMWIREYRTSEGLLHHFVTALVTSYSLTPFGQHYVLVMGIMETSSLPLALVDAARFIPGFRDTFPRLVEVSGVAFAASFLAFRVGWWCPVIVKFWEDLAGAWVQHEQHHPVSRRHMEIIVVVSVGLTVLQCYWGRLVVSELKKFMAQRAADSSLLLKEGGHEDTASGSRGDTCTKANENQ
jgi:hypothetical protein